MAGNFDPESRPPDDHRAGQETYVEAILRTMRQPLVVLRRDLSVERANQAFYTTFQVEREATEGHRIYELGNRQWDIAALRRLLEDVLPSGGEVTDFKVEHSFEGIGRRVMMLNAHQMDRGGPNDRILLAIDDITEREDLLWELEGQKEFAEKIVDASRDPLLILGWDLTVKAANETFYETFQVDRAETEGRMIYDLGNGQWNIAALRELLENVLPENNAFNDYVVEHEFEDIGHRIMVLNARRVDHMDLILLAIEDQTEARRASAALRESEQRYRTLFEAIDEGFCILEMIYDDDGTARDYRFLQVNPAFTRHTGLVDAAGRTMRELEPNHEQHWFDIYGWIATTGEPARFEQSARHLGNRWYDVYAFRIDAPELRRVAVIFRDVSDRRAAESALHESEQRFRVLVETTAQAVWETDPDGSARPSESWDRFTGQSAADMRGDGWAEAVHPDDRERALREWRDCVASERPLGIELRLCHAEGGWRWTYCNAAPIRDADGRILKWVGMNRDITRRKEAEAQRELLLGELNHRVKNIFAIIRVLVSQSVEGRSTEEAQGVLLGRLDALVQAHALALESRWESVDLAQLAELTMRPYRAERPEVIEIDGRSVKLKPRPALSLSLVLHELATNAVKYGALSTPSGRVTLQWRLSDEPVPKVHLRWCETGGPPVVQPEEKGFGTQLVDRVFDYELGGDSKVEFNETGLRVEAWLSLI